MWQAVGSELVFTDELWPDFSRKSFEAAIEVFSQQTARESRETLSGH
jgi:undecaprenyl diphosphate synthase